MRGEVGQGREVVYGERDGVWGGTLEERWGMSREVGHGERGGV